MHMANVDKAEKNTIIVLLLWFMLGWLGAHHFYLGNPGKGVGMFILWIASILTMVLIIGFFLIFVWFIWWAIDGVKIITRLSQANSVSQ